MISKRNYLSIHLFVLITTNGLVNGLIKKWMPNTNFENPENWDSGRTPCYSDVVRFPEDMGTVYIQTNTSVREIVLPMNGEIVLASHASLSFPSGQSGDKKCQGQEVTYNGSVAHSWYDPENWCEVADLEGSCLSEVWPHLDTERLPCEMDQAVFPRHTGFVVDLESGVDIFLGKLTIRGKDFTTGEFQSYIRNARGRKEFLHSTEGARASVNIKGDLCRDPTGCACGNEGGLLEEKVCAVQAARCNQLSCNSPLLPQGHCCHICGSIMMLEFADGFKYKSLENMIHNIIPKAQRQSVKVMVSRMQSEQVQIVVEDVDGTGQDKKLVDLITQKIKPDSFGNSRYRISKISIMSSDQSHSGNPQAQTAGSKIMAPGSLASLIIAILAVLAIIALFIFCLIDRRKPNSTSKRMKLHIPVVSWPFRRFGHDDGGGGMELGPSAHFQGDMPALPATDIMHGFDNPTYHNNNATEAGLPQISGNPVDGSSGIPDRDLISTIDLPEPTFVKKGQEIAFANPMYGDQRKVEDVSYLDSSITVNPIFSTEGLEEDSQI